MTDTPTPNIPLLRKCVEWVEAESARPGGGHWNQGDWVTPEGSETHDELVAAGLIAACGTAYCVAGYIGSLSGDLFDDGLSPSVRGEHVDDYATRQLGLSSDQADELFRQPNSAEDVRRIAEEIAGERL